MIKQAAEPLEPEGREEQRTMIYDKIDNIDTYKGLSDDLFLGLEFLKNATPDIENGVHEINSRVKAIVSEYETKKVNENGFEAHKKFIDIQYVLYGAEKVCSLPLDQLQESIPYKEESDAAFYTSIVKPIEMEIGDCCFAVFFPQDGHMPCLSIDEPTRVKKVVVKVAVR